jgi:hypothetical protein
MWTVCEAGREAAVVAAENVSDIVIATSASDSLQHRELTVSPGMQSSLKAIARRRQQPGQVTIRQSYEHIERLRKRNNRVKMVWEPPLDDSLTMSREVKRQTRKSTRVECTPRLLPYQARSMRTRLVVAQLHQ